MTRITEHRDSPYWVHSAPDVTRVEPCVRGCKRARQHVEDCEDNETCRGCLPRTAEFGLLCHICHLRLADMLCNAPAQHRLLLAVVAPSFQQSLTSGPKAPSPGPRMSSGSPFYMQPASTKTTAADEGEPVRVAALDTAQQLADMLSEWVEMLTQQHELSGPQRLTTPAEKHEGRSGHWRWSRWPLAEGEDPEAVWSEPPARFEVEAAARWLTAQLALLETCPGIGDLWTELGELMSQAHALAPWRQAAVTLKGITCPDCHHLTLRHFFGDDHVTCTHCKAVHTWARTQIWVRELEDRRKTA